MNKTQIINLLERLGVVVYFIENEGDAYRVFVTVREEYKEGIIAELKQYTEAEFEYSTELIVYK
jgi:hypothetical protein